MGKGGVPDTDILPLSRIPEVQNPAKFSPEREFEKSVAISIYDEVKDISGEINTKPILAKIKKIADSTADIKLDLPQQTEKSRLEKRLVAYKNLLASIKDAPDFLPNDFDTSGYNPANVEPQPIAKLYYYSAKKDQAEVITNFPVNGRIYTLNVSDLDEDGNDELLYSIDGQLFMKRLISRDLTDAEKDNLYQVSNDILHQDFAEFARYFSPSIDFDSGTDA
jgi:hypothetical protein